MNEYPDEMAFVPRDLRDMVCNIPRGSWVTQTGRIVNADDMFTTNYREHYDRQIHSVDFEALERRIASWQPNVWTLMYSLFTGPEPIADWLTPDPLPQDMIDQRPQPLSAVSEMTHASYYGDPRQAQPWRGDARAARHPVDALPNRGPRRQRW
jgi:hypothetical protein